MGAPVPWPKTRAILDPRTAQANFQFASGTPEPALAPFVGYYWFITWDLRGREPHRQQVLPHPVVHMTFMPGRRRVAGVIRGHFTEELRDAGRVIGIAFRPGGFRPLLGAPVSTITDRFVPVADVFGPAVDDAAREIAASAEPLEVVAGRVDALLRTVVPEPDPTVDQAADVVAAIAADPALTRVDAVAAVAGLAPRSLQRLFREYVGVGPKWVIRRYRMHEAAVRVADGADIDWAELATDLGYADQAHFTRDFTATVGTSPARYARSLPSP